MTPDEHERFTRRLVTGLEADPRVVGLVGLGSTAAADPLPDRWSDHDLWLVTEDGAQDDYRGRIDWLPDAGEVAWWYRETEHGLGVVYRSGHLVEVAIFGRGELHVARANRARVLLDRGGVADAIAALQSTTAEAAAAGPDPRWLFGQVTVGLIVASARWARGERLSARRRLLDAVGHLLRLLASAVPSEHAASLDDLDPFRRVERVWPELGAALDRAVLLPAPEAAAQVVALVRSALPDLARAGEPALAAVERVAADAELPR